MEATGAVIEAETPHRLIVPRAHFNGFTSATGDDWRVSIIRGSMRPNQATHR